jgi:hypothetical protein
MVFCKFSKVALILVLIILVSSDHIMYSQGEPLTVMHRRFNLFSHSDGDTKGTMIPGTISPDSTGSGGAAGGGVLGEDTRATDPGHSPGAGHAAGGGVLGEDTRATDPGHSPGAGHAATNNGVGRKLLGVDV